MAVRDDRKGKHKDHKLFDGKITHKEFGEDDNEGHDAALWKNRTKDWYNAERRFIFAAKGPKTRNKWIEQIVLEKVSTGIGPGIVEIIAASRANRILQIPSGSSPASGTNQPFTYLQR